MTQTGLRQPLTTGERPYSVSRDGAPGCLRLHGTIDEVSAPAFRQDLRAAARTSNAGTTVVDLRDVDHFSAAAVGALVTAWREATTCERSMEVVVRPGSVPQRVISLCGLPHRGR